MSIEIVEASPREGGILARYATIPIAFPVVSQFCVRPTERGLGGLRLVEEALETPYVKDYDALPGEGPIHWSDQFDLSNWGLFLAVDGEKPVGGAVVARETVGVDMLEGRSDLAVLWDLRVHPDVRGRGVGQRLFATAEEWARSHGCREFKIETQNINVAACRFYARQGCVLRSIRQNAYPELPNEVQLLWGKSLNGVV